MNASLIDWKAEPLSPQSYSSEEAVVSDDDIAFYWPTLEQDEFNYDLDTLESKAEVASKLLENLDNLNDLDDLIKEEEPFASWFEDKVFPIYNDVSSNHFNNSNGISVIGNGNNNFEYVKNENYNRNATSNDTQSLLQEFENIFDEVEMTHDALTPPHSPQHNKQQLQPNLITLVPVVQHGEKQQQQQQQQQNDTSQLLDVDHELAVVDELVRTRVQDMVVLSPSSSSSDCSLSSSSSDDPEWMTSSSSSCQPQVFVPSSYRKKSRQDRRNKPYGGGRTSNEDRKSRKKEQNKNAATRYRMKKKAETEVILEEEKDLSTRNDQLADQVADLKREIKYLKGLMRDLFKAKGLIN